MYRHNIVIIIVSCISIIIIVYLYDHEILVFHHSASFYPISPRLLTIKFNVGFTVFVRRKSLLSKTGIVFQESRLY